MFYDFIKFRNTMIKLYYRTSIKDNKNTTVVSDDEQMFSNENEFSNDEKIIDQFSKLHDTEINAATPNAITSSAVIFDANASNAAALSAFNRAKSKKIFQSLSIKRGRDRF